MANCKIDSPIHGRVGALPHARLDVCNPRRVLETVSLSWYELGRRTWREALDDDVPGIAAQLAYYFFLSLFPALLFLVALASFFPLYSFTDELIRLLAPIAPQAVVTLLKDQLTSLSNSDDASLLSIGLLMALWSSSAALVSVIDAMNRAFDIEDTR